MSEGPSKSPTNSEREKFDLVGLVNLAFEFQERGKHFPFPGIYPQAYEKLKAADEEDPGFTTPIDVLIARCNSEGIKVVLGKNFQSGNVYVLPAQSDDIEQDSINPKYLHTRDGMDERLKKLILMTRERAAAVGKK